MTPRQLEALRKHLHFTVPEAARWVAADAERPRGVEERTWNRWESGKVAVPVNIAERIVELVRWRDNELFNLQVNSRAALASGRAVSLLWYDDRDDWPGEPAHWRPAQSAMGEFLAASLLDGVDLIRLVPFDAQAYHRSLGGGRDTENRRAVWASIQPDDTPPPRMVEMRKATGADSD